LSPVIGSAAVLTGGGGGGGGGGGDELLLPHAVNRVADRQSNKDITRRTNMVFSWASGARCY
jgi:hypothetical protein